MSQLLQKRRKFLRQTAAFAALVAATDSFGNSLNTKPKTILLRSSWQTVNISDIGPATSTMPTTPFYP